MRITKGTGTEVRRFMRSATSGFTAISEDNVGKAYNMSFSVQLAQPLVNKTDSEVKSYLDKIARAVSGFSESDTLNIDIDIVEHGAVEYLIAAKTKEHYEASQQLEVKPEEISEAAQG